ncbi:MAG: TetR/AcrR family transcriptional regulator [Bacilli bacterium]|nr:TetR/AcrR family transcriptional regulator [Bacilli bacterium]
MPSKAYERLSKEKEQRILEAAYIEFSNYSLEKASMNSIAKNAGMSRTTLYYYFRDIDDIFSLIIEKMMLEFKKTLNYDENNKIDIFEAHYRFFEYVVSYKGTNREKFIKQIFSDMNLKLQKLITEPYIDFFVKNKQYVKNLEKLNYENRNELFDIMFSLFALITACINYYYNNDIEYEVIEHKIKRGLHLLKYGVIKEEYRKEELENE